MAELEPIKGYNCTKIAIYLKSGFCEINCLQIPTPPRPFNVFEPNFSLAVSKPSMEVKNGAGFLN